MSNQVKNQEVITLCQKLIRAKSYSGEEQLVAKLLKTYFIEQGFDEVIEDEYGNVIGKMVGKRPGKKLLFDGHMDTVPVTDEKEWHYPAFGAEIHDGKIYGRGASDMKGALAAMAVAVSKFAKACHKNFPGEIYVAGVVHEECFEGVAARNVSRIVEPDYVVIGEASELNLKIGQRGRAEIKLETFGVPAHSANPEKGVNAVYKMFEVGEALMMMRAPEHPVLGKGIMELTDIKSSPYPGASVVPEYCMATYDRRLLVGETKVSVLAPIKELFEEMMRQDDKLKVKVSYARGKESCYTGNPIEGERFFPGWLYSEEDEFVKAIMTELQSKGFEPKITEYQFCTNGSHYAGEAHIPTVGMGPSKERLAHTINEYIEIKQLVDAVSCYGTIMKALLKEG